MWPLPPTALISGQDRGAQACSTPVSSPPWMYSGVSPGKGPKQNRAEQEGQAGQAGGSGSVPGFRGRESHWDLGGHVSVLKPPMGIGSGEWEDSLA